MKKRLLKENNNNKLGVFFYKVITKISVYNSKISQIIIVLNKVQNEDCNQIYINIISHFRQSYRLRLEMAKVSDRKDYEKIRMRMAKVSRMKKKLN